MKKLQDLKKVLGNLELEGQGRGIIMGVIHLLLLGLFYYIAPYWVGQTFLSRVYNRSFYFFNTLFECALWLLKVSKSQKQNSHHPKRNKIFA